LCPNIRVLERLFGAPLAGGIREAAKAFDMMEDRAIHVKGLEPAGYAAGGRF